jgi:hypothetical protein
MRRFYTLLSLIVVASAIPFLVSAQGLVPCTDDCDFADFIELVQRFLNYLIYIVATPIAAIMFGIAGFYYLTAGEDTSKVKKAHDIFISVLWGFGTMLIAWALVSFIFNFFTNTQDPQENLNLLEAPTTPPPGP